MTGRYIPQTDGRDRFHLFGILILLHGTGEEERLYGDSGRRERVYIESIRLARVKKLYLEEGLESEDSLLPCLSESFLPLLVSKNG